MSRMALKCPLDHCSWEELRRAKAYIINQMTVEYGASNRPSGIQCGAVIACITTAYDDATLCLKARGSTVYLQSTVSNLFGMNVVVSLLWRDFYIACLMLKRDMFRFLSMCE